jgi:hypothetical protein
MECPEPRSAAKDAALVQQRRELGLESYEFGQAPMLKDKDHDRA